jgi:hypothetical protein
VPLVIPPRAIQGFAATDKVTHRRKVQVQQLIPEQQSMLLFDAKFKKKRTKQHSRTKRQNTRIPYLHAFVLCQTQYRTQHKKAKKAKQSKAKQSKAKQSKAKQSKAKQSKAKQSKAKQSKAKQSKARDTSKLLKTPLNSLKLTSDQT